MLSDSLVLLEATVALEEDDGLVTGASGLVVLRATTLAFVLPARVVLVLVVLDVVTTVLDFRGFVRGDVAVAVGVLLLLLRVTDGEETKEENKK